MWVARRCDTLIRRFFLHPYHLMTSAVHSLRSTSHYCVRIFTQWHYEYRHITCNCNIVWAGRQVWFDILVYWHSRVLTCSFHTLLSPSSTKCYDVIMIPPKCIHYFCLWNEENIFLHPLKASKHNWISIMYANFPDIW